MSQTSLPRRRLPQPPSPTTSSHSSLTGAARALLPKVPAVTFMNAGINARPPPIVFTFDSDDAYNNVIRSSDGKAQYLVTTAKKGAQTFITGRREGVTTSTSLNTVDRPIATLIRSRWKSDKVAFGTGPPSDVSKLFETPRHTDSLSEVDRSTFSDETDRRYEWRGAHIYRALQLWTVDPPQLLVAQFRFPEQAKPQLILEPPHEGFANIDMIIVTFLLLDKDRKRGDHRVMV